MTYARVHLATNNVIAAEPLPAELVGLADCSLADLAAALDPCPAQYQGIGYWPVDQEDPSVPAVAEGTYVADAVTRRVRARPSPAAWAAALAEARAEALRQLNEQRCAELTRHVPPALALLYAEKQRQALEVMSGAPGPWPMLEQEAEAAKMTVPELAAAILAKARETAAEQAGPIEATVQTIQRTVRSATSPTEVWAVMKNIVWPD